MLSKEECASGMGQSSNYAATKVAQAMLRKEEYAVGMGQRLSGNYVAKKVARIRL